MQEIISGGLSTAETFVGPIALAMGARGRGGVGLGKRRDLLSIVTPSNIATHPRAPPAPLHRLTAFLSTYTPLTQ